MKKEELPDINKVIEELDVLLDKTNCHAIIINIILENLLRLKENLNTTLTGLDRILDDIVSPQKARDLLNNERKPGFLNLMEYYPHLREKLTKIATKKYENTYHITAPLSFLAPRIYLEP